MRLDEAINIITDGVERIAKRIKQKKPATGKYMSVEKKSTGASIIVPFWFPVFEHGRGRRKSNEPSKPQPPKPFDTAFEYNLYRWMRSRGMLTGTAKQQERKVKGMRYLINKNGTELYRKTNNGTNPIDVYKGIIQEETETIKKSVTNVVVNSYSEIIKSLK